MASTTKRVYLDVCALNRPLDDQSQIRVRLEADAVMLILSHVRLQNLALVASPAHRAEIAANPDPARRRHVELVLREIGNPGQFRLGEARQRAKELHTAGLQVADAAHVALAEQVECDFVTVDDRLLRKMKGAGVKIWYGTPLAYCDKEDLK